MVNLWEPIGSQNYSLQLEVCSVSGVCVAWAHPHELGDRKKR